jgi:transcriptional regulator with XRE-family HTH domain
VNGAAAFGHALRDHRYALRLTQAELAERAGLSERAISDLERGLKTPQRATVRLLIGALSLAPEVAAAFELIARAYASAPDVTKSVPVQHNIPGSRTSFVGREHDIARLRQMLDPRVSHVRSARIVTLTGSGGCGKTRLAVELAHCMLGDFPDGIRFVDFSSVADPVLLPTSLLTALEGGDPSDLAPLETLLRCTGAKTVAGT